MPLPMLTSATASAPEDGALVDEGHARRHGANEREGLEVDALEDEPGLLGDLGELLDHVALRRDDEDALPTRCRLPTVTVSRRSKSRMRFSGGMGMLSLAQNSTAGRSSLASAIIGKNSVRTTIFWLATPRVKRLPVKPALLPERLELGREEVAVDDLALEQEALLHGADVSVRQSLTLDLDSCHGVLFEVDAYAHTTDGHACPSAAWTPSSVVGSLSDSFRDLVRRPRVPDPAPAAGLLVYSSRGP